MRRTRVKGQHRTPVACGRDALAGQLDKRAQLLRLRSRHGQREDAADESPACAASVDNDAAHCAHRQAAWKLPFADRSQRRPDAVAAKGAGPRVDIEAQEPGDCRAISRLIAILHVPLDAERQICKAALPRNGRGGGVIDSGARVAVGLEPQFQAVTDPGAQQRRRRRAPALDPG